MSDTALAGTLIWCGGLVVFGLLALLYAIVEHLTSGGPRNRYRRDPWRQVPRANWRSARRRPGSDPWTH